MTGKKQKSGKTRNLSDSWTVRGVSPETRTAAKQAARRSGLTLGAWLDREIRLRATESLQEGQLAPSMGEGTSETMNAILRRLESLEEAQKEKTPPPSFWRWFLGSR